MLSGLLWCRTSRENEARGKSINKEDKNVSAVKYSQKIMRNLEAAAAEALISLHRKLQS